MPVTLKTGRINYKNPSTGNYVGVDGVAEKTTAEMVSDITTAGQTKINAINAAGTTQLSTINTRATEVQASIPASGEMEDMVAVPFSESMAYPAGKYVIQNVSGVNKLYRLPDGHTAGTTWADTNKVGPINLGDETTDLKSAINGLAGGNNAIIKPVNIEPYVGSWAITNATTGKVQRSADSSYYSSTDPIDIRMLKTGTQVTVNASITGGKGAFLVDKDYYAIDYVNGNNASSKGYTPSSIPAPVTFTVTENSCYILTDIRSTYWSEKNICAYGATSNGIYKNLLGVINDTEEKLINLIEEKTETWYSEPEDYGAIGDGEEDDTNAFVAALAHGKTILCKSNATYKIDRSLSTLNNVEIDLNGGTILVNATITIGDYCTIKNGTVYGGNIQGLSNPVISISGKYNKIENVNFEGGYTGKYYVVCGTNSDEVLIARCHFDGYAKVSVWLGGNHCHITQCIMDDTIDEETYSNCVKLSAGNLLDTTTPCARNTKIDKCIFGTMVDNCIDCFVGAMGLIVEQCTFKNGTKPGIEIKNKFYAQSENTDHSYPGVRVNRDITIKDCIFTGTDYAFTCSASASESYTGTFVPVRNVKFINCRLTGTTFINNGLLSIGSTTEDVLIDGLQCAGLSSVSYGYMRLYGKRVFVQNINHGQLTPLVYGDVTIKDCYLYTISAAGANTELKVINCSSAAPSLGMVNVSAAGKSIVVRDCQVGSGVPSLVQLIRENPTLLVIENSIAGTILDNTNYAGTVYLFNNLYRTELSKREAGIAGSSGNFAIPS